MKPPPRPPAPTPSWASATGAWSNAAASRQSLVAVARSILVIVWQLLSDPTARFHDLGPDYHTSRVVTERKIRNYIAHLTAIGFHVTLQPAA